MSECPIPCAVAKMQPTDDRMRIAQHMCMGSLNICSVKVIEIPEHPRPRFGRILQTAREAASDWFAWINSDCQLLVPLECLNAKDADVVGMRRVEVGPGRVSSGVDGFLIRTRFWDEVLSLDVPEMWIGATHLDWWLSRATQKYGKYEECVVLAHLPHDPTTASDGVDIFGRENIENYLAWAERHGVSKA